MLDVMSMYSKSLPLNVLIREQLVELYDYVDDLVFTGIT